MGWRVDLNGSGNKTPKIVKKVGGFVSGYTTAGVANTNGTGMAQTGQYTPKGYIGGATGTDIGQPAKKVAGTDMNALADKAGQEGLNLAQRIYGQDLDQTGANIKESVAGYKERLNGTDPISEGLKQQAGEAEARAGRAMAGRGVAGAAAAGAVEQARKAKDIDIASMAYQQKAQNMKDYANINANIAANTVAAKEGAVAGAAAMVKPEVAKQEKGVISSLLS